MSDKEPALGHSVKELLLFGSAVRGEMRPESDIDVMVEFEPGARVGLVKFESLAEELVALSGRKVDLVTRRGLKPRGTPLPLWRMDLHCRTGCASLQDLRPLRIEEWHRTL